MHILEAQNRIQAGYNLHFLDTSAKDS